MAVHRSACPYCSDRASILALRRWHRRWRHIVCRTRRYGFRPRRAATPAVRCVPSGERGPNLGRDTVVPARALGFMSPVAEPAQVATRLVQAVPRAARAVKSRAASHVAAVLGSSPAQVRGADHVTRVADGITRCGTRTALREWSRPNSATDHSARSARKLGQRIAACRSLAAARAAPSGSLDRKDRFVVVRHTHSVSGTGVALGRFVTDPTAGPSAPRHRARSTHLLRRLDAEQSKPRRENGDNALHQRKASHGHLWIILDNEA